MTGVTTSLTWTFAISIHKETDMKRLMTAMCMAALLAATAAAQTMPPMDKGKMPAGKMDKSKMGKAITVTGCVAAGTDAEHFTLTNGMMTGETTGKSYDLMGGELKSHLGHKVAVTGTLETGMAGKDKMAAKPRMEKEDMGEHKMAKDKMAPEAPHSALHVTSVKMIAATCP
jgi:hypothetical protein